MATTRIRKPSPARRRGAAAAIMARHLYTVDMGNWRARRELPRVVKLVFGPHAQITWK